MGPRCYVFGSDVSCSLFLPTLVSCWFRFALVVVGGVSRCVGFGFALTSLWFRVVLVYVVAASCMIAAAFCYQTHLLLPALQGVLLF